MEAIQEGKSCLLSGGTPDSPVHTEHCSVPDSFPSMAKPTVGSLGAVGAPNMSGAHRTVRCLHLAIGSATCPAQIAWPTVGSPDSPVCHPTEGKICLPGLLPTAPRPLMPIKGTPRRLQQYTSAANKCRLHWNQFSLSLLCVTL